MIEVIVALPPSVNHIWKMGRRRVFKSRDYTTWMNAAAWTVKQAAMKNGGPLQGDVRVKVSFFPRNHLRDLDNMLKGVCDALVQGGAIVNDNMIVDLRARWYESGAAPHARIQVAMA